MGAVLAFFCSFQFSAHFSRPAPTLAAAASRRRRSAGARWNRRRLCHCRHCFQPLPAHGSSCRLSHARAPIPVPKAHNSSPRRRNSRQTDAAVGSYRRSHRGRETYVTRVAGWTHKVKQRTHTRSRLSKSQEKPLSTLHRPAGRSAAAVRPCTRARQTRPSAASAASTQRPARHAALRPLARRPPIMRRRSPPAIPSRPPTSPFPQPRTIAAAASAGVSDLCLSPERRPYRD